MKKIAYVIAAIFAMLTAAASAEELDIVTTSFPCYDFAKHVAGDAAEVHMLIQPGMEVHSFDPAPADILAIDEAGLFVYIGGESDAWADRILDSLGEDAPERLRLIECVEALEEGEHDHEHAHDTALDEHIWTSPKNAVKMVRAIEEALCAAVPESAELFRANADDYVAQIEALDVELTRIVESGARRELVFADRFPFLYLANDYGLDYVAAFDSCAAESEPSMKKIFEMIEKIEQDQVPVVYTIEMSTGNIARTIVEETGVETLMMHSVQTVTRDEFDAGESYVSLMQKNLQAIEKGLN